MEKDNKLSKDISMTTIEDVNKKQEKQDLDRGCDDKPNLNLPSVYQDTISSNTGSVGVGMSAIDRFHKRHNTCPQISPLVTNRPGHPSPRDTKSLSLPQSNTRKSFFGELRNLLTFNKKKEELDSGESQGDQTAILDGGEKENKKVALQNRRKQVFQSQEDETETSNVDFTTVGSTV